MSVIHTPTGQLWLALDRVHATIARSVHGRMAEYGLTVPQYRVLKFLNDEGVMSANTLAERIGVTPGNLTGVLDRLETAGLVRRERAPQDRRSLCVQISPAGAELIGRCLPDVRRHVAELLAPLSEEEVASTMRLLNRLETHLTGQSTRQPGPLLEASA